MKILIFTNHFYPEQFKVNDVAFYLSSKGEKVTVITGIPNYPKGKFYKGYGFFHKRNELINGVKVIRLPLIPRGNGSELHLTINYLSFFLSTIFYIPFLLFKKFDKILVHETSPVFIGIAASLVKKITKTQMYFWVLDLWPESITAVSKFSNKLFLKTLNKIVYWIYKCSDKILISSRGFKSSIVQKGHFENKIIYFPNWAEDIFNQENNELVKIPDMPNGFKIMYAGNIGEAQDFESIMNAILILKNEKNIKWIFIGDGRKKLWLDYFIKDHNLEDIVYPMGRYNINTMPSFYKKADVMLLSLRDEPIFSLTVPARLQSYMACGKPILAMINGEASKIIREAECGLVSNSGDSESLANNIQSMIKMQKENFLVMGYNAKKYYNNNFDRKKLLDDLYRILSA